MTLPPSTGMASGTATSGNEPSEASTGMSSNDASMGGMMSGSSAATPPTVYFDTQVWPIIMTNCTAHHKQPNPSGGLDMSSEMTAFNSLTLNNKSNETGCTEYYELFDDAVDSLLYQKVSGMGIPSTCGVRMPQGGPYLSSTDIQTIQDWLLTGSYMAPPDQ
jgi:hypothetical protein